VLFENSFEIVWAFEWKKYEDRRESDIGVVKLKQYYMIMTSDAKWEKRNGHKNCAR
jgi:hypothetical protein